jgi:hypothetical protein
MESFRFDDIFQVKGGVPIIAGLYIGMDEEEASPLHEELLKARFEHSYEYPEDLIYELHITFQYYLFPNTSKIKRIVLYIPRKIDSDDVTIMKDYLSRKYYNERVDEILQKKSDGQILGYMIDIYNDFYHFSMYSDEKDRMVVDLRAVHEDYDIYDTINIISQDRNLKEFIKNSITYCEKTASEPDGIEEVIPIIYGLPAFYNIRLGDERIELEDIGYLDDIDDDTLIGNKARDDYDIHYQVLLRSYGCVDTIILSMPHDSEGVSPVIKYLKKNFLYDKAHYDLNYSKNRQREKELLSLSNSFVDVDIREFCYDDCPVVITITATDEDHPEKYRAMYNVFENEGIMRFFDGVGRFYKNGNDTQDAKFNVLRMKYDTFEEALNYYTGEKEAWSRDMGGYSHNEFEHDKDRCLEAWNTPGSDGFPISWINVGTTE